METAFQDDQLLDYSESELVQFLETSPSLEKYGSIILLSSRYLAKSYRANEAEDAIRATELAVGLGIHVPRIRRTVIHGGTAYCIMDRILGKSLEVEWPRLGWIATARLALQLRQIINRLRSIPSPTAGSPVSGECRSFYIEDRYSLPPRADSEQINSFINFWVNFVSIRQEVKKTRTQHSACANPVLSGDHPLVFTHHDLAPRNILLDSEGQVWLTDWDEAGWYPKFFEYAAMHNFIMPSSWSRITRWRWNICAWVAAGFYDKEARWLDLIRSKFTRFPAGRRFNMKANGFAAAAGRVSDSS